MAKNEHIHKYKRVILGGTRVVRTADGKKRLEKQGGYPVFKCVLPGCTHYIAREIAIGHECLCWVCNGVLAMNSRTINQTRPRHIDCAAVKAKGAA